MPLTPETPKRKVVITYGTFDLLHAGHISILQRAKALGDFLIVGVTGEDYDRARGKLNVLQSLEERLRAIQGLNFVDEVIVEHHKHQKAFDIQKYGADIFVLGDDWRGKFDYLNEHCQVVYLPRTEGISSTLLRSKINKTIRIGIVGTGRIASRFASEAKHVDSIELHAAMSTDINNVQAFIDAHAIPYGHTELEALLESGVDAVYIASPHHLHYSQAKLALESGRHVLCEKPATLKNQELNNLITLAQKNNLVFLEAIKTAFFEGFSKLQQTIKKGKIGELVEIRASFSKLIQDATSREWQPPYGGAVNELASYPLLLATRLLGPSLKRHYFSRTEHGVDSYTTILCEHANNTTSISTVGIGAKTEGCAIISGTKGYIYIPSPWWITKTYSIRHEDHTQETVFHFDLDGDGLRYEIAEFASLIQRQEAQSARLKHSDMLSINHVICEFNENRKFKLTQTTINRIKT